MMMTIRTALGALPVLLLLLLPPAAAAADRAQLGQVQTVYLLPMGSGLDQYLANRLTSEGVFHVVTDVKKADAVIADQVGAGFERRMEELLPPEEPQAPAPPPVAAGASKEEIATAAKEAARMKKEFEDEQSLEALRRQGQRPLSTFSRGKGNVFLIDVKSRRVLWSLYERPKKMLPDDLDRTSVRIVSRLKKDLAGKP